MYSIETSQTRKFIGEFTRGTDLNKALEKLFKTHSIRTGNIKLNGHLSYAGLLVNSNKKLLSKRIEITSNIQLLNCWGIITERDGKFDPMLYAICAYPTEVGWSTIGGVLVDAKILVCDFILEVYDDVLIRKSLDQKINIHTWHETFVAEHNDQNNQTELTQIESTKDSETNNEDFEDDDDDEFDKQNEEMPNVGDIVHHFTFGKCVVLKVDTENDIMLIKLPNGRTARLGMSVLRFIYDGQEKNVKIFKAVTGKRR